MVELELLVKALKSALDTDQYVMIMSLLPLLNRTIVEIQKESDNMTPRHLITLMQEVIQSILCMTELETSVVVPEQERCVAFVESHYTPYVISEMINEGIDLTRILMDMTKTFGVREIMIPQQEVERVRPPRRVVGNTDSIRKKHH